MSFATSQQATGLSERAPPKKNGLEKQAHEVDPPFERTRTIRAIKRIVMADAAKLPSPDRCCPPPIIDNKVNSANDPSPHRAKAEVAMLGGGPPLLCYAKQ